MSFPLPLPSLQKSGPSGPAGHSRVSPAGAALRQQFPFDGLHLAGKRDEVREVFSKLLLMTNLERHIPGVKYYLMKKRGVFKTTVSRRGGYTYTPEAAAEIDHSFAARRPETVPARLTGVAWLSHHWPTAGRGSVVRWHYPGRALRCCARTSCDNAHSRLCCGLLGRSRRGDLDRPTVPQPCRPWLGKESWPRTAGPHLIHLPTVGEVPSISRRASLSRSS